MSLITDLKAYVGSYAGLAALIAARLYPISLPQEPILPAATYLIVSDPQTYSHSGPSYRTARIQFDAYAANYLDAQAVADQFEAAANAWRQANPAYIGFQLDRHNVEEPAELARYREMVEIELDH